MNLVLFLVFVIILSPRCSFHITPKNICTSMLAITVALIFDYLWFKCNLLLLCGDVEFNPGTKQNTAPKHNLVRSDHPWNKKRGDVCTCYKSILPIKIIDINYSNECVRFEVIVVDKLCNRIALYRSPWQLQDLLESVKENLKLNLESAVQIIPKNTPRRF